MRAYLHRFIASPRGNGNLDVLRGDSAALRRSSIRAERRRRTQPWAQRTSGKRPHPRPRSIKSGSFSPSLNARMVRGTERARASARATMAPQPRLRVRATICESKKQGQGRRGSGCRPWPDGTLHATDSCLAAAALNDPRNSPAAAQSTLPSSRITWPR